MHIGSSHSRNSGSYFYLKKEVGKKKLKGQSNQWLQGVAKIQVW